MENILKTDLNSLMWQGDKRVNIMEFVFNSFRRIFYGDFLLGFLFIWIFFFMRIFSFGFLFVKIHTDVPYILNT